MKIGIVVAMAYEAKALENKIGQFFGEIPFTVRVTSPGLKYAEKAARQLLSEGHDFLISWGVSGGKNVKMRFRPSHFPFTEPSAEVDIGYSLENGKIVIGEGDKWLEVLGCGMVHPNVLKNVKVDTKKYQGYAFGIGIDRLAMLKYGINDLRAFFETDYRWISHFGFDPLDVPTNYRGLSK